ncbi:sensor domain-containing protein [Pengzhenrongella sp.]|jgi:diguanylate cyclase (GGDEF)-like protein/PAS domain S-box-containing protein|uniref:sensor domain-containing protein n=1 Tax=Pengzhenrongella sp. TaxID=2888820 RepID=UPI002F93297D
MSSQTRPHTAESLLVNSPDFVVRFDLDGNRLYVNPTLAEVYGVPPEELLGRGVGKTNEVVDPESVALMRAMIVEVVRDLTSRDFEITYRTPGGARVAQYRLVPELDEHGRVIEVLGLGRDVTELARVQRELVERETRFRDVFDNALDSMFLLEVSPDGQHFRNLEINPALARMSGIPREAMVGKYIEEVVPPEVAEAVNSKYRHCVNAGVPIEEDAELDLPAGRRWYHSTLIPARDETGRVYRIVGITRDITERHNAQLALAASEERFRLAFDDSLLGMALLSVDGEDGRFRYLRVNKAMCEFLGLTADQILGRPHADVLAPEDADDTVATLNGLLSDAYTNYHTERRFVHANGETVWGLLGATLVRNPEGAPLHVLAQVEDITTRKRVEEQLAFRALHDDLTGLPNRALLMEHLGSALARSQRNGTHLAVFFLDLDDFKSLNDSFGHAAGDAFLIKVAARIGSTLRASDIAARIGGDEFVVVCENLTELSGATVLAEKIQRALAVEIDLDGHRVTASASIGVALSHEHSTPENLLHDADAAMYVAKHSGGQRWQPADASLHAAAIRVLSVEAELRRAIEQQELRVHYQPLVDLHTGAIVGVEALVRWQHPQRGLLLPREFLDVAEQRGLIGEIGQWVLRTACNQAGTWRRQFGDRAPAMSVNVSSRQLGNQGLHRQVDAALAASALPVEKLILELTESQLLKIRASATTDLRTLSERGVKIAIDDFGTGHAGYEYLRRLPVDEIKIDKSFTQTLNIDRTGSAITAGIVALGLGLGLTVVAKGIETTEQLHLLRDMGCTWGQGWLWHRALPADEIHALIAQSARDANARRSPTT